MKLLACLLLSITLLIGLPSLSAARPAAASPAAAPQISTSETPAPELSPTPSGSPGECQENGDSCTGADGCAGSCCNGECITCGEAPTCQTGCGTINNFECQESGHNMSCSYNQQTDGAACGTNGNCNEEGECECLDPTTPCASGVCCTPNQMCCAGTLLAPGNSCQGCGEGEFICGGCVTPEEAASVAPYIPQSKPIVCCRNDQRCEHHYSLGDNCVDASPSTSPMPSWSW